MNDIKSKEINQEGNELFPFFVYIDMKIVIFWNVCLGFLLFLFDIF